MRARFWILAAICLALAGCTGAGSQHLLAATTTAVLPASIAAEHGVFIATTRARAKDAREVFDGARAPQVDYAEVDITVPAAHKIGQIERRRGNVADPSKYFTARKVTAFSEGEFKAALRADIKRSGGRALVFIHGYNTSFDAAVYRMTQIVHDAGTSATPVLFSWASGGRTLDYVYDTNSATAARDALEATLRLVAEAGATRIDIVAHSMGNWVTMEALRQLAIAGDPRLGGRIGDVILASPDIDIDVFKAQMARYGKPERPFVLMTSADDKALRLSAVLAGARPRVGDSGDAAELAGLGVVVVDLSQVQGDRLAHTKFAENPVMIKLIGDSLNREELTRPAEAEITRRVDRLSRNLGGAVGTAAEIIITTPVEVLKIAVGQ